MREKKTAGNKGATWQYTSHLTSHVGGAPGTGQVRARVPDLPCWGLAPGGSCPGRGIPAPSHPQPCPTAAWRGHPGAEGSQHKIETWRHKPAGRVCRRGGPHRAECTGRPKQNPPRAGGIGASEDRPTVPTPEKRSEGRCVRRGDQNNRLRKSVWIRVPGSRRTRPQSSLGVCPFLFPFSYSFSPGGPPSLGFSIQGSRSGPWGPWHNGAWSSRSAHISAAF